MGIHCLYVKTNVKIGANLILYVIHDVRLHPKIVKMLRVNFEKEYLYLGHCIIYLPLYDIRKLDWNSVEYVFPI